MAKIIVGVTIIEFCKGGSQLGEGGEWSLRIVYIRVALICERLVWRLCISIFKIIYPFNVIMTVCLWGIKDQRILLLLNRNLQLLFGSLLLLFYSDVLKSFSNYYTVTFPLLLLLECLMKTVYNKLVITLPIWFWIFSVSCFPQAL